MYGGVCLVNAYIDDVFTVLSSAIYMLILTFVTTI
jgi:hypothetical protein